MNVSKKQIFIGLVGFLAGCVLVLLIDSYIGNKQCKNTSNNAVLLSDSDKGPRTLDDYSEEERQVYAIVMDECMYDIKLRYTPADNDKLYVITPCTFVAKDVVRAIFNSGTLSSKYTIKDVYEESKNRVIKASLKERTLITKENK